MLYVPSLPGRVLFALIIGINRYSDHSNITDVKGSIADADDIQAFLTRDLHVSQDCIVILRDENATHANIVQEILNFAANDRIAFNDPILIYYAGHGREIQGRVVLFPHDATCGSQEDDKRSILDIEFNDLLKRLANEKGNNITVILDACHAGGFGGKGYAYASLDSHVLLAACSRDELAPEVKARGVFTNDLTTLLRQLGPRISTVTYRDIIKLLPDTRYVHLFVR
ncbi:peptidase C14, caspase domain-containing protein [Flammula alnicola]|nr:peptidase C14, caspase domain-containing protein [Flammula alnicola]